MLFIILKFYYQMHAMVEYPWLSIISSDRSFYLPLKRFHLMLDPIVKDFVSLHHFNEWISKILCLCCCWDEGTPPANAAAWANWLYHSVVIPSSLLFYIAAYLWPLTSLVWWWPDLWRGWSSSSSEIAFSFLI